jgi:hypothetical protein
MAATTLTPRQIIKSARSLPLKGRREVLKALQDDLVEPTPEPISEEEINQILFERGVIGPPPDPSRYTDEDDDFEPIKFKGKPVSEILIEDRR